MIVVNGKILTMAGAVHEPGYVAIENGKIVSCGPMDQCPADGERVDAAGGWVLPGLVDIHTHLGLFEDSLGFEGEDGNEDTDPITPQLRALDGINPLERSFAESRAAGVTTVLVSPGSANPIGGQIVAIKTAGRRVDDMVIRQPAAMKMALGENPKHVYNGKNQAPVTRMATAALIRQCLREAQEYDRALQRAREEKEIDPPDFDPKLDAMLPVVRGEIPVHIHAHRADDLFTAIRIAKEFHLSYVLIHGTQAHLVADLLGQEGAQVVSGPYLTDRSKPELQGMTPAAPALLWRAGLPCAITTDHPETPLKYLMDCAAAAVKHGMDEGDALAAITIQSARIGGVSDRVGSLEPGKDADLVVYSGNPFHYQTTVRMVLIDGHPVKEEV